MKNREYWAKRAARDMRDTMEDAETVAMQLMSYYVGASNYLQDEAKRIFEKFQLEHGLTRKEAERILKKVKNTDDLKAVLTALSSDSGNAELLAEYEAHAYRARISRLSALSKNVDRVTSAIAKEQVKETAALLKKVIADTYNKAIFRIQQYSGYGFNFKDLSQKTIGRILRQKWHEGDFSEKIWGNLRKLAQAIKKEIMINLLTGRDWRKGAKAIDDEMQKGYNNARRLIRTESAHAAGEATKESYKECNVEKYIYVAILDLRTSMMCRNLDGKTFELAKAKAGTNYPPMHPWCRSTTIAWMPKELLSRLKRSALDPETGKVIKVPADMTYEEWYEKYVKGKPKAEEGSRNLTREQYDRYKDRLNNDFNMSYDEFVRMKEDEEKWAAYQKSYRDSGKSDKYNDLTAIWLYNTKHNKAYVKDADHYTSPNGDTYRVDNVNVVLDYDPEGLEKAESELLSRATGEVVQMCPRVTGNYSKIKSPDYIVGDEEVRWDHKTLHGNGKNALRRRILGKDNRGKEQAENYLFNIDDWKGERDNVIEQAKKIFLWPNTKFVNSLVLVEQGGIIMALVRK